MHVTSHGAKLANPDGYVPSGSRNVRTLHTVTRGRFKLTVHRPARTQFVPSCMSRDAQLQARSLVTAVNLPHAENNSPIQTLSCNDEREDDRPSEQRKRFHQCALQVLQRSIWQRRSNSRWGSLTSVVRWGLPDTDNVCGCTRSI